MFNSGNMNEYEQNSGLMFSSFYNSVEVSVKNTSSLSSYLCKRNVIDLRYYHKFSCLYLSRW